jgi:hypothetical protein
LAGVVKDLRIWLEQLPDVGVGTAPDQPLLALQFDSGGHPSDLAPFKVQYPLVLDHKGRLRLNLISPARSEGLHLSIAIYEAGRSLFLCSIPVQREQTLAIIDCSFLDSPKRTISPDIVRLTLAPAEIARQSCQPRLLRSVGRLLDSFEDPVEFWDHATALFYGYGEDWQERLRSEIAELKDPTPALASIEKAAGTISFYAETWAAADQQEESEAYALASHLMQLSQITHRSTRPDREMSDLTIARPRKKTTPRTAGENLDPKGNLP